MKQHADSKCEDIEYQMGDYVFLKLDPYHQQSMFKKHIKSLNTGSIGYIRLKKNLERWVPSSSFHKVLAFTQSFMYPF